MANDDKINRQSLNQSLDQKYANSKVGGAYDAKKVGTSTTGMSINATTYDTNPNFVVKQSQGQSNFKGTSGNSYKEISKYSSNLDTRRYK
jgi:hypothetical protein